MYGSPTADFSAKGRVIDEKGQPIQGLQVILGNRWHGENYNGTSYKPIDSLQTGPNGEYEVFFASTIPITNLQIDVNDIDGEANGGTFESATVLVKDIQYEDGKGWYEGSAEILVPDITLKKK
jgi:putative lipoprotein (rSAM/lipoprotein system)